MQVLTILADLRTELHLAEQVTAQAWACYAQNVSDVSFTAAVDATQCVMVLHRQLASRLQQLLGEAAVADGSMELLTPQTWSAA